jgi:two-component system, NarL family, nitrate/nitrite response regulator NarL
MPKASSRMQQGEDDSDGSLTGIRGDHENSSTASIGTSIGMGPMVPTALICDNALLRRGLQHILSGTPFVVPDEGATTGSKLVSEKVQEPALCILVVDQLSSRTPEMVRQVKERNPAARIVVVADHLDPGLVVQAHRAGVDGFCLTGSDPQVLIISLELVMLGELALPTGLVRMILSRAALSPEPEPRDSKVLVPPKAPEPGARSITAREAEILRCLVDGAPNKMIARKLDVAEATVKVHVKAILRKIGATNRTQAAMWAMDHLPTTGEASLHG